MASLTARAAQRPPSQHRRRGDLQIGRRRAPTVGDNNLSTTVSGTIQDGGGSGGTGASLVKAASFIVNGATPAKESALASAGAELRLPNGVSLIGKFDGEFASRAQTYAGTGTVRYAW
jgi:hypothetical protein